MSAYKKFQGSAEGLPLYLSLQIYKDKDWRRESNTPQHRSCFLYQPLCLCSKDSTKTKLFKKKKKSEPKIHYKWKRTFLEYLFVFILTAVLFVICDWIWTVCGCLGIKCMKSSWGALNASSYCLVEMSHPPQNSGTLVATTQDSLGSAKWYRKFGGFFFVPVFCLLFGHAAQLWDFSSLTRDCTWALRS